MMKPDIETDHRNGGYKNQSSPGRRFQHQRKDAIETTSQMHTLDYKHDDSEYYDIAAAVSAASASKQQHYDRAQEDQVASTAATSNQPTKGSYSGKNGWFSLPWSNNSHASVNQQHQQHPSSIPEVTDLHDPTISTISDRNGADDTIIPSSPKRRARKLNFLESNIMPESHRQVKNAIQNHNDTSDDTTATARSEMEYTSLHEPQHGKQCMVNDDNVLTDVKDDCSFFFRSDELTGNNNRNQLPSSGRRQQQHEWKTIRRDHYKQRHNSGQSIMYEYSDAVAVTPMPILQHYRTKFAQLNSELITERGSRRHRDQQQQYDLNQQPQSPNWYRYFDYDNYVDHHVVFEQQRDPFDDWHMQQSSLQLQEYDAATTTTTTSARNMINNTSDVISESQPYYNANNLIPRTGVQFSALPHGKTTNGIIRSDTARQSSLFFMADGRMLMRLPRDRVRLLVDPDLEVGVLSVEQWRVVPDLEPSNEPTDYTQSNESHLATNHDTTRSFNDVPDRRMTKKVNESTNQIPELRYVLTVSDDLYRKIVEEMSPTNIKYFCCARGCCNDEEKVDIRIAFGLLGMTLLILFVNMLAFREH